MNNTITCYNPNTNHRWDSNLEGPTDNVLNLSQSQINQLPNINQVVEFCHSVENIFINSGGWDSIDMGIPQIGLFKQLGLNNPWGAYDNNGTNEDFIVSRLNSGRFALKPNLMYRPFLYRGQNPFHPRIVSGFDRCSKEEKLIANLKVTEFILLLRTHPLFRMFDAGINLDGYSKTIFFEMNYYGLAQHYGFNTGLLDFSSDIEVSAFFGATKWLAPDKYCRFNNPEIPYGVIYHYSVHPSSTFISEGFSSIGLQVFPRSGQQKGFLQDSGKMNINVNPSIIAIPFRHDAIEDQKIIDRWHGGQLLFTVDELSPISDLILDSKEISLSAFAYNLFVNPQDNEATNRKMCKNQGYTIKPHLRYVFTEKILEMYFDKIRNGWWEDFCNRIYWGDSKKAISLKQQMIELPRNMYYWQYFHKEDYRRLYYHQTDEEFKASRV